MELEAGREGKFGSRTTDDVREYSSEVLRQFSIHCIFVLKMRISLIGLGEYWRIEAKMRRQDCGVGCFEIGV